MATLKNTNPISPVYLPLLGRNLEMDEEFDISDDWAANLLAQLGNYELVSGNVTPLLPPDSAPADQEVEPVAAPPETTPDPAPSDAAPTSDPAVEATTQEA